MVVLTELYVFSHRPILSYEAEKVIVAPLEAIPQIDEPDKIRIAKDNSTRRSLRHLINNLIDML